MIWDALTIAFRALIPERDPGIRAQIRRTVSRRARRWARASVAEPYLRADLLAIGRVLSMAPRGGDDALAATAQELAYDAGRRDLALELLALMAVTPLQIHHMMQDAEDENDHDDDDRRPLG